MICPFLSEASFPVICSACAGSRAGIIPALEPAHALHITGELATKRKGQIIIMNMCGRGDKDLSSVLPLIMKK